MKNTSISEVTGVIEVPDCWNCLHGTRTDRIEEQRHQ